MRNRMMAKLVAICVAITALVGGVGAAYADENACLLAYTGEQNEFVAPGSQLFSRIENGLPGDVFSGSLAIANESDDPCEVFVSAQDVVASGPDDMLERIPFTLTDGDSTVFEGSLSEASNMEPISLGVIAPSEALSVDCVATIPAELTNAYAGAAVGMNMAVAMAKRGDAESIDLIPTGASAATAAPTSAGKGTGLVQAGDMLAGLSFILGALAAAGAVIWCAWKRRMRMW